MELHIPRNIFHLARVCMSRRKLLDPPSYVIYKPLRSLHAFVFIYYLIQTSGNDFGTVSKEHTSVGREPLAA
jgi:hypothetical protein